MQQRLPCEVAAYPPLLHPRLLLPLLDSGPHSCSNCTTPAASAVQLITPDLVQALQNCYEWPSQRNVDLPAAAAPPTSPTAPPKRPHLPLPPVHCPQTLRNINPPSMPHYHPSTSHTCCFATLIPPFIPLQHCDTAEVTAAVLPETPVGLWTAAADAPRTLHRAPPLQKRNTKYNLSHPPLSPRPTNHART
jgi:hypothetical protein